MAQLTEHVSYEAAEGIAHVRLTRADVRNVLSDQVARGLVAAMAEVARDRSVRAVVLAGEGPWFCAGGDLRAFAEARITQEQAAVVHEGLLAIHRSPAPVIAAIAGGAIGYGMGLASACDIRVAEAGARFQAGFTGIGLSPDSTTSYFMPRLLGLSTATAMMMTNDRVDAERMHTLGFVWRVVPEGQAIAAATELAERIRAMPSGALTRAKRVLATSLGNTVERQVAVEVENILAAALTDDFREGVTAFVERRPPRFDSERTVE